VSISARQAKQEGFRIARYIGGLGRENTGRKMLHLLCAAGQQLSFQMMSGLA
jgi:hypothetical protein